MIELPVIVAPAAPAVPEAQPPALAVGPEFASDLMLLLAPAPPVEAALAAPVAMPATEQPWALLLVPELANWPVPEGAAVAVESEEVAPDVVAEVPQDLIPTLWTKTMFIGTPLRELPDVSMPQGPARAGNWQASLPAVMRAPGPAILPVAPVAAAVRPVADPTVPDVVAAAAPALPAEPAAARPVAAEAADPGPLPARPAIAVPVLPGLVRAEPGAAMPAPAMPQYLERTPVSLAPGVQPLALGDRPVAAGDRPVASGDPILAQLPQSRPEISNRPIPPLRTPPELALPPEIAPAAAPALAAPPAGQPAPTAPPAAAPELPAAPPETRLAIATDRLGPVAVQLNGAPGELQISLTTQPAAAALIGAEAPRLVQDLAAAGVALAGLSVNGQRTDLSGGRRQRQQPRAPIDIVTAPARLARAAARTSIDRLA